jgi:hypothetical protein
MFCQGHVEDLLEAEHGALGVGSVELLLTEVRMHLVQAGLAKARLGLFPPLSGPVKKGLCGAVQLTGPVPVA